MRTVEGTETVSPSTAKPFLETSKVEEVISELEEQFQEKCMLEKCDNKPEWGAWYENHGRTHRTKVCNTCRMRIASQPNHVVYKVVAWVDGVLCCETSFSPPYRLFEKSRRL